MTTGIENPVPHLTEIYQHFLFTKTESNQLISHENVPICETKQKKVVKLITFTLGELVFKKNTSFYLMIRDQDILHLKF